MALSRTTLSIKGLHVTLSMLSVFMLYVVMLSVFMLSVVMLSVILLNVTMQSVMAQFLKQRKISWMR